MSATGLSELNQQVQRSLHLLGDLPANWVVPRADVDHDVAIIGAGQTGLAALFGLRRAGVTRVTLLDGAQQGATGSWLTKARMNVLRTPKRIGGPELGIPALSFQAWYEAQHGAERYQAIGRIDRHDWGAYLEWYREVLELPVRFATRLISVEPAHDHLVLTLESQGRRFTETTRKLVLATGGVGSGRPNIPDVLVTGLPPALYSHTDASIDFSTLRGKAVAVVGAGSSAFDAAAVALEQGASRVHLLCRREDLPRTGGRSHPALLEVYPWLDDERRLALASLLRPRTPPPPKDSVLRATRHENFHLHLNAALQRAEAIEGRAVLGLGEHTSLEVDFVVAATGYEIDLRHRTELSALVDDIATWADRHPQLQQSPRHASLLRHPYLDQGYELTEKRTGQAPYLRHIHLFSFGGTVSFGGHVGDVPSLPVGIPRLVAALVRNLFVEDFQPWLESISAEPRPVFDRADYAGAVRTLAETTPA